MKNKFNTVAFTNLIGSVVFLIIGIVCWIMSSRFQTVKGNYVQPADFPKIMIIGLIIFAAILFIVSLLKIINMKDDDPEAAPAPILNPIKDKGMQAALMVIAVCIGFVALFSILGYVIVSALACLFIMFLIGKRNWKVMVPVSILVPLGMWLLFYTLLKVNIPLGPLTFMRDIVDMIF